MRFPASSPPIVGNAAILGASGPGTSPALLQWLRVTNGLLRSKRF
uniref:Floral homeotic protein APETALA 2 isoform X3 n=1 Tax=Rhizophora mucronata TaxID=61149 RepID=A0A2P2KQK4_RHIMU